MPNYSDIIERLEKATGPDRELDCKICKAIGKRLMTHEAVASSAWAFTRLCDDAMTLTPKNCSIKLVGSGSSWEATVSHFTNPHIRGFSGPGRRANPAIAVASAALKARAALAGEGGETERG